LAEMRPERLLRARSLFVKSRRTLAAVLLAVFVFPSANAQPAGSPPQSAMLPIYDAQSFIHELQRLKAGLDSAKTSTENLRAYREALPEAWAVDAGGRHYDVPAALLASRLLKAEKQAENREQEIEQARKYLDALAAETASTSALELRSADAARGKLKAILARSEFAQAQRQISWWDRLRSRLNEILLRALRRLLGSVGGQKSFGYILLWIGVCAAAVLIAYWIFRNWFRSAKNAEMALQAAVVPLRSWQEWVCASREAAGRGDYRGAIHCAYWAGVTRLQELGALAPDRAKTPREYLGALGRSRILQPETYVLRKQALSALTSRLEHIWYGYGVATETDFRESLAELETLGCHLP
jgi:Domain of unknown function (DUF4129)